MKMRFCYKLDKEISMVEDKNGNKEEGYALVKVGTKKDPLPAKEYQALVKTFRKVLAHNLECDIEKVTPITLNQYLDATEEEDNSSLINLDKEEIDEEEKED